MTRRGATKLVHLGHVPHIRILEHEIGSRRGLERFSLGQDAAAQEPIGPLDDLAHPRYRQAMFLRQVGEALAPQKAFDQGDVPIDGRGTPQQACSFSSIIAFVHPVVRAPANLTGQLGAWNPTSLTSWPGAHVAAKTAN